jgi:hypothetical protein
MERDSTGEEKHYKKSCRPETLGTGKETHRQREYAKRGKNSAGSCDEQREIYGRILSWDFSRILVGCAHNDSARYRGDPY